MAVPAFQRFTAAVWKAPRDPTIFADVSVDSSALEAFLEDEKKAGRRVTITAILARCVGEALAKVPELNVEFRWGLPRRRKFIDAWITFSDEKGRLSGKRFDRLHERSLQDIQAELDAAARSYKKGESKTGNQTNALIRWIPLWLLRRVIRTTSWFVYNLRIGKGLMGVDKGLFGALHITNVGTFGLGRVSSPIPTFQRLAFQLNVGAIYDEAKVRNGKVVAGRTLPLMATVDHRAVVGNVAGRFYEHFRKAMEDPETLRGFSVGRA